MNITCPGMLCLNPPSQQEKKTSKNPVDEKTRVNEQEISEDNYYSFIIEYKMHYINAVF